MAHGLMRRFAAIRESLFRDDSKPSVTTFASFNENQGDLIMPSTLDGVPTLSDRVFGLNTIAKGALTHSNKGACMRLCDQGHVQRLAL